MISLDSHTISVKEVELEPHFSERQRVVYNKSGEDGCWQWADLVLNLGSGTW